MPILVKYYVATDNGVIDVMAYDGYDARRIVTNATNGRAIIRSIWRA